MKSQELLLKTFVAKKTDLSKKYHLKTFSKSIKGNENMSLKIKTPMGEWISTAAESI